MCEQDGGFETHMVTDEKFTMRQETITFRFTTVVSVSILASSNYRLVVNV